MSLVAFFERFVAAIRGRPLIAVVVAFIAGCRWHPSWFGGAVALAIGAVVAGRSRSPTQVVAGLLVFFFAAGQLVYTTRGSAPVAPFAGRHALVEGVVVRAPSRGPQRSAVTLQATGYADGFAQPPTPWAGRVRVRVGSGSLDVSPGDRLRVWARWRPPRNARFPGDFDGAWWAAYRGHQALGWTPDASLIVRIGRGEVFGLRIRMEALRDRMHRVIDSALPASARGVVRAFATGDTSGLDDAQQADFQRSGLSHLLAVSGLNLAIVAGLFVVGLGAILRRSRWVLLGPGVDRVVAAFALPFVGLYTLLVGASPSAVRAAWMVACVLIARAFR
ncbi:MAG: ComEC/Rec2 family competence protein, partial [Myxococcota bacterium]